MRIATWNVNSVRQRLDHVVGYLETVAPDILCLQELKCTDDAYPRREIEACGYHSHVHGQKGFNGVAILAKTALETVPGLPGDPDDVQARFIEARVPDGDRHIHVASIYLPNGNPVGSDKYPYKLAFMDRLIAHARQRLDEGVSLVLAGDFNVIPESRDVADPENWTNDALFLPTTREKFRTLLSLGLTDALRATTDAPGLYTFWDYQAGAWQRNKGLRIDHLLLSPQVADRLLDVTIDKDTRAAEKPSDHVPVRIALRPSPVNSSDDGRRHT